MYNIVINGNTYKCPEKWEDINLGKAAGAFPIINRLPENMKKIYRLMFTKNGKAEISKIELTDDEIIKLIPSVQGELIAYFCDIPKDVMENVSSEDRTAFFSRYIMPFVVGLLVHPYNYEPKGIDKFTHKGIDYYLPMSSTDVNGENKPLSDLETICFTESADLQLACTKTGKGNYKLMGNIISILCRPKGEKYNEQTAIERAKEFQNLPMSIVWEVFFYLSVFSITWKNTLQTLSAQVGVPVETMLQNMGGMRPS